MLLLHMAGETPALIPLSGLIVNEFRLSVVVQFGGVADSATIAIARDSDTIFGILHSPFHELWSLRLGSAVAGPVVSENANELKTRGPNSSPGSCAPSRCRLGPGCPARRRQARYFLSPRVRCSRGNRREAARVQDRYWRAKRTTSIRRRVPCGTRSAASGQTA